MQHIRMNQPCPTPIPTPLGGQKELGGRKPGCIPQMQGSPLLTLQRLQLTILATLLPTACFSSKVMLKIPALFFLLLRPAK